MISYLVILSVLFGVAKGGGHLLDPPSRSSAWRVGFDTPENDEDDDLSCGGYGVLWYVNEGKCGVCGDPWDSPQPRDNELGGIYGKSVISRYYMQGQTILVNLRFTANLKGWFELRLCPLSMNGKAKQDANQECFDKHLLLPADGSNSRIIVPEDEKDFLIRIKLPRDVSCDHCVLQWHYNTGSHVGKCKNGKFAFGCGEQPIIRNCADIRIFRK